MVSDSGILNRLDNVLKTAVSELAWSRMQLTESGEKDHGVFATATLTSNRTSLFVTVTKVSQILVQRVLADPSGKTDIHLNIPLSLIVENPETCADAIRRAVISDAELHPVLSNREFKPHLLQKEAIAALKSARELGETAAIVSLPTGTGKTILAALEMKLTEDRCLFVAHRNEIIRQAQDVFATSLRPRTVGIFNGFERDSTSDIVCANVHSLSADKVASCFRKDDFSLIVIDEFHHGAAPSYVSVLNYFRPSFVLGLTATPFRTDGRNLAEVIGGRCITHVTAAEGIRRGFLAPFEYHAFHDNIDYSGIRHNGYRYDVKDLDRALIVKQRNDAILREYKRLRGKKGIAFCVSIRHAESMAAHFREHEINCTAIHSQLQPHAYSEAMQGFRDGKYELVFVRDIFNEGVDVPDVDTLLFLRPTESDVIFMQQLGRGLRLSADKQRLLVLDFIGNYMGAENVHVFLQRIADGNVSYKKAKPLLQFDNGCEVNFSVEAIESIGRIRGGERSDLDILREVYRFFESHGRVPRFADLSLGVKSPLIEIFKKYGTWNDFIDRLHRIDSELPVDELTLPPEIGDLKLDEVGAFIADSQDCLCGWWDAFISDLEQAANLLRDLARAVPSRNSLLAKYVREFRATLRNLRDVCGQILTGLDRIAFFAVFSGADANAKACVADAGLRRSLCVVLESVTGFRDVSSAAADLDRFTGWCELMASVRFSQFEEKFELFLHGCRIIPSVVSTLGSIEDSI